MNTPVSRLRPPRSSRSWLAFGVWAFLGTWAAVLLSLPWLWWQGGLLELPIGPHRIRHEQGFAHRVRMWPMMKKNNQWSWIGIEAGEIPSLLFHVPPDSPAGPGSTLRLYEDGTALGPEHSSWEQIATLGEGRFVHLADRLVFSASDNSNPRRNGRDYVIRGFSQPRLESVSLLGALALGWLAAAALLLIAALRWRVIITWVDRSQAHSRSALWALSLVGGFSAYVFCFASLTPQPALRTMLLLGFWSALYLLLARRPLVFRAWMAWPACFLVWSAAGPFWTASSFASWTTLRHLVVSAAVGVVIYSAMHRGWAARGGHAALLGWTLCSSFAIVVSIQNLGFDLKALIAGLDTSQALPWQFTTWNQKYQEGWLLVLSWTVVGAMASARSGRCLSGVLLTLSGAAIFTGYSYTGKLAFLVSGVVFLGAVFLPRTARYCLALAMVGTLLLLPPIVGVAWSDALARSSATDWERGVARHAIRRLVSWEYARELSEERPWVGWGLGAAAKLPGRQETAEEILEGGSELPAYVGKLRALPGGHPHSLPFLIWMETGLVGILLACGAIVTLFRRLSKIHDRFRHGAFLALAASLFAFLGLNFPSWEPTILMMTLMTTSLIASVGPDERG